MKEKPLLFCNRSILAWQMGQKTQTRRLVRPQPLKDLEISQTEEGLWVAQDERHFEILDQPYAVGDRRWIREALVRGLNNVMLYAADNRMVVIDGGAPAWNWKRAKLPAMFMPKFACRYHAEVLAVRPERLQDISDEDVVAEGTLVGVTDEWGGLSGPDKGTTRYEGQYQDWYAAWWDSLHKKAEDKWAANPQVWRYVLEPVGTPSESERREVIHD